MFNPNDTGVNNGNIFGFPYTYEESQIVIIPVCSDITCSYGKGTANAPQKILEESTQLDFYSPYLEKAWEQKVFMLPINQQLVDLNQKVGKIASGLIHKKEQGVAFNNNDVDQLNEVNAFCEQQTQNIKTLSLELLNNNKTPIVLGGDHSSPLGLINALTEKHDDFGVLQIDAHADLRDAYEGFTNSHASTMFNSLKQAQISKLVQVGVRDICQDEVELIKGSNNRIKTFFDWDLKAEQYQGKTWKQQCDEIIAQLPQKVYISFDIDGLDPKLSPNTGTPVPGGLEFEQASYLLNQLTEKGKKIIGADLCEVGNHQWDASVGARALYLLSTLVFKTNK
ncbi:MAG: agmatinase family protein [Vicingaceae bacterium]|nr:agmatinase family protein [Vicingaceae bacterium]